MKESFSTTTKDNICRALPKSRCCRKAFLYGVLRFAQRSPDGKIILKDFSETVMKAFMKLINEFTEQKYKKGDEAPLAIELGRYIIGTFFDNTSSNIDEGFFCCEECIKYFFAGVFLVRGCVVDPDKEYRLELVFTEKWNRQLVGELLSERFISPLYAQRNDKYILYYKAGESVEDFLNYIGAQRSAFALMNTRIEKDIRNNTNRFVNCDAHNIERATGTGRAQAEAIEYLIKTGEINTLPDELRVTANLRYNNPELPLTELAALHEPVISKSGLNHRLRKITEKARESKEKNNK